DGSVKNFNKGVTGLEIASSISQGLARNVLAAKVDGEIWDATRAIDKDVEISLLTWKDAGGKKAFWHSSAHLMAEALEDMFPGVKLGIGPPIENGFYYDIDLGDRQISDEDLTVLEKKMKELARQKNEYIRKKVSKK